MQMTEFFGRDVKTIGKHINNALKEELAVVANFATTPSATGANFATVQLRESTCSILERDEVGKDFLRTDNTNTYKLLFTVLLLKYMTL